jgi:hypothetical protein
MYYPKRNQDTCPRSVKYFVMLSTIVCSLPQVANQYEPVYRYVWTSAGKQPELEKAVGVGGFGYPAMVALNVKKAVYAPLRGAFEQEPVM